MEGCRGITVTLQGVPDARGAQSAVMCITVSWSKNAVEGNLETSEVLWPLHFTRENLGSGRWTVAPLVRGNTKVRAQYLSARQHCWWVCTVKFLTWEKDCGLKHVVGPLLRRNPRKFSWKLKLYHKNNFLTARPFSRCPDFSGSPAHSSICASTL